MRYSLDCGVGQALAQRIRVALACNERGSTVLGVAKDLGVSREMVATWRQRFAERRLEGLVDAPRPMQPPHVGIVRGTSRNKRHASEGAPPRLAIRATRRGRFPAKARTGSRRGGHAERSPERPGLWSPRPRAEEDAGLSE